MTVRVLNFSAKRALSVGAAFAVGMLIVLGNPGQANAVGSVQATVGLGTADSYEVLAATTVTNTGGSTVNNGDVGLSPGTSVTGFPPGLINNGVIHAADAQAEQAQVDLTTAYNDAAGRTVDQTGLTELGTQTFDPGVYSGGALTLNGTVTLRGGRGFGLHLPGRKHSYHLIDE